MDTKSKLKIFLLDVLPVSISKRLQEGYERPEKGVLASFVRLIFFILTVQYFIVKPYMVPTGSMNHTIENNDFLLVNRFIYGVRTPDNISIPFTYYYFKRDLPFFRFTPEFNEINSNDIIVFRADHEEPPLEYVKRCVGAAGDSIKTVNGVIYVNNIKFENAVDYKPPSQLGLPGDSLQKFPILKNTLETAIIGTADNSFSVSLGQAIDFPENKTNKQILKDFIETSLQFTGIVKNDFLTFPKLFDVFHNSLNKVREYRDNVNNYIKDVTYQDAMIDVSRHYLGSRSFAHIKNPHDFKNIYIPKEGDVLEFDRNHFDIISNVVYYDGHTMDIKDGKYYIDGVEATNYTVEQNYYFVIGDNRAESLDSRNWGFVPRKYISGAPILIYFSLTQRYTNAKNKSFTYYLFNLFDNIRYDRIGKMIL